MNCLLFDEKQKEQGPSILKSDLYHTKVSEVPTSSGEFWDREWNMYIYWIPPDVGYNFI